MADEIKSLDDLKDAVGSAPAAEVGAAVAARAGARRAGPVLRHRQAQGRRRTRLDQAGLGQGHGQRQGHERLFRASGAADDPAPAVHRSPASKTSSTSMATVAGGGLSGQAGAVKHGISKALQLYDPSLRSGAEGGRLPDPRQPRGRAQEVRPPQGPPQLPVLETLNSGGLPVGRTDSLHSGRGSLRWSLFSTSTAPLPNIMATFRRSRRRPACRLDGHPGTPCALLTLAGSAASRRGVCVLIASGGLLASRVIEGLVG